MGATLGQAVRDELQRRQLSLGPIVSHPRSRTWTFLVKADIPDSPALFGQLFRAHISVHRTGCRIGLPSPADPPLALRYWVEPPRDPFRPSGAVVISVLSNCLPARTIDLRMLERDADRPVP
ncbi:hypothetical protein [Nocardia cyriacigeorgica]|uniref:hypothetical protein n=1 Tax=Nocardia cyriacigeorgica TaxID=135487 RepID=UPI0024590031|nr:hypothetical protein [Nocardia cyriacigeorgica]